MSLDPALGELYARWRERTLLESCATLLGWDEETYLPPAGVELRGEQHALLARLEHERATDPRLGELLDEAAAAAPDDPAVQANLRALRDDFADAAKVPASLVEELARVTSRAQSAWAEARDHDDPSGYLPVLARVVELVVAWADCVRGERGRYDACLDEWEPDLTEVEVVALLAELTPPLTRLADRVRAVAPPPAAPLPAIAPAIQRALCREVAGWLGFDFDGGRLDEAAHPSTMRIGPGDVRLTTRIDPERPLGALASTMHEVGHGIYDQNLPAEHFGTPIGEATSLGLHESQARLVERIIGGSHGFWRFALPRLTALAPGLAAVSVDDVHRQLNRVARSPVRIGADDVTYDLHIAIRVDLERALVRGDLRAAELPGAWDDAYARTLVRPTRPREGCLQDGHWAAGMFGYFPTYTLGNVIAAQLAAAAAATLGDLDALFAAGAAPLLMAWMQDAVHRHGSLVPPRELVRAATGAPIGAHAHLARLERTCGALYRL